MVSPAALADADGDPFMGRIIEGRYAVVERLGAGSMATVYRARQEAMARDVALKIVRADRLVDPQAKGRFEQEARATSRLTSPHTVTVFDFGEINIEGADPELLDGSLYLAMELLDGESLGDRLKREGRIEPGEAARIVRHALRSLIEAHGKGVIHRDLKPDNLILTSAADSGERLCKVLDFGIAKLMGRDSGVDALETQAGTVFGTPRYMSPEQAQGKQLDARSDLYSLGVILYHMLAGRPPYTDNDAVVVMAHHIKTKPQPPGALCPDCDVPAQLEELIMRLLSKEPRSRPQSAAALLTELEAMGIGDGARGGASGELTAVVGRVLRSTPPSLKLGLAASVALLIVAGALSALHRRAQRSERLSPGLTVVGGRLADRATSNPARSPRSTASAAPSTQAATAAPPSASAETSASPRRPARKPRRYQRFDR